MIILYGSNGSPFVSRIRMQGYAKELPIALRQAALGTPEFRRLNPLNKGPVLEHDGASIQGSSTILDYIQQRLGARKLAVEEFVQVGVALLDARQNLDRQPSRATVERPLRGTTSCLAVEIRAV